MAEQNYALSTCRICNYTRYNHTYKLTEMMYGFRDKFDYFQCSACGCLQIKEFPNDMNKYYPPNYYSFANVHFRKQRQIIHVLSRLKTSATLNEFPFFKRKSLPCWLLKKNVNLNSRILDVGCGAGKLLTQLYYLGFKNLTGVDPYISQNYNYGNKVKIWKKELYELNEEFDFIMLHHCFEHLQNPKDSFDYLAKIIASTGTILIRIPIISSFAWQIYKTHWIQLDPPRHFFLHSIKSIELLAMNAGLKVESIDYDSTGFQFWGSELYKRDIAYEESKNMVVFSGEEITKYNNYANILNNRHEGDQACFYLKKC